MVANTRKIADTTAADQNDAMLLEVVTLARNVADHFALIGQANFRDLSQRRVRLLRSRRIDPGADAALLRILLHRRNLRLCLLRFATLTDQLINRWHEALHLVYAGSPGGYFAQSKMREVLAAPPLNEVEAPGLHVPEQCSALAGNR